MAANETISQARVFVRVRPLVGEEISRVDDVVDIKVSAQDEKQNLELSGSTKNMPGFTKKRRKRFTRKAFLALQKKRQQQANSDDSSDSSEDEEAQKFSWNGNFNGVFLEDKNNKDVYQQAVKPLEPNFLQGGSSISFCYGQTGSGKTHTSLGYGENGLYYHSAESLCQELKKQSEEKKIKLYLGVKFFELYQRKVYDLLDDRRECAVREGKDGVSIQSQATESVYSKRLNAERKMVVCRELKTVLCDSADQVKQAVEKGIMARKVGTSLVHDQSSRSHAFIEYRIMTQKHLDREAQYSANRIAACNKAPMSCARTLKMLADKHAKFLKAMEDKYNCFSGALCFVDLAGSEHGDSEKKQTKQEKREALEINKSLLAVNNVMKDLLQGSKRIAFRDSALTLILSRYLNIFPSLTCEIACISPSLKHAKQTIKTARYAHVLAQSTGHGATLKDFIDRKNFVSKARQEAEAAYVKRYNVPDNSHKY